MATNTTNYNLKKPDQDDFYNIQDFNDNADSIDKALTPTADPAQFPESNGPFKLIDWVSYFANRIKAITGLANWWNTPNKSLKDLEDDITTHKADLESLKTQIEEPIYTTHTQNTPVSSLPIGSLDGTVKDFKAEGLTRVNLIPSFHSWENLTLGLFNILSDYEVEMTISDGINKLAYSLLNVKPDTNYTFKVEHNGNIAIFNKDGTLSIVSYTPNQEIKFNTASHTQIRVYLRNLPFTNGTYYFKNPILEEGTVVGDFIEGMKSVENPTVEIVGKNLFDKNKATRGKIFSSNAEPIPSDNSEGAISDFIQVKSNTTYIVSHNLYNIYSRTVFYDSNKKFLSRQIESASKLRTTPVGCKYIRVGLPLDSIDDFMIVEGDILPTEYEPHKSSKLTANVPLRRVPNGVKDRLFYSNGALWLEKNVGEYVLKESDITSVTSRNNVAYTNEVVLNNSNKINIDSYNNQGIVIERYTWVQNLTTAWDVPSGEYRYTTLTGNIRTFTLPLNTTLEQAKTILAGTVIQYQLAQPQLINLTEQGLTSGELISAENGTVYNYSDTFHSPNISFDVPSNIASQITALLQSANSQAKQIESKANKVQEDWIEPTLLNGWVNHSVDWSPVGFIKDNFGFVKIRGMIKAGTANSNIFILPINYRPLKLEARICPSTSGSKEIRIHPNGTVYINGTIVSNDYVNLGGISFQAEK